jgi:hypothetical protein
MVKKLFGLLLALTLVFAFTFVAFAQEDIETKTVEEEEEGASALQVKVKKVVVNPTSPFYVDVWVDRGDGGVYRPGDKLYVYFKSDRDCYLTLIDFPPQGGVTIIFPNAYHSNNFVRANRIYRIPAPSYGFDFIVEGPPGTEVIKAIATLGRINLTPRALSEYGGYEESGFAEVAKNDMEGADFVEALAVKVKPVPTKEWASDSVTFYVRYR